MELLATWAQRNGATPDPITDRAAAAVAGRAYTTRHDTDDQTDGAAGDEGDDDMEEYGLLVDPEDVDIDPDAELPDPEDGDDTPLFGQESGHKPSPDEARRLFAQALEEFENEGRMVVGPKDFTDWCDRHSLSRSWVSKRLKDAALEGRLEQTNATGRWRIVPALTPA